jgi:4-aminobutyrate aminotransferase-like enzyme
MNTPAPASAPRTTAAWQDLDRQHYLHPFTDYKALQAKGARVIVRAEGVYLYDSDGNRILDGRTGVASSPPRRDPGSLVACVTGMHPPNSHAAPTRHWR